ncbi:MAG TPA: hypothetical protein VHB98_19405 [Chloroflexota bacterium]|nr:hypothetical protein [Chloroflexota bacterium]
MNDRAAQIQPSLSTAIRAHRGGMVPPASQAEGAQSGPLGAERRTTSVAGAPPASGVSSPEILAALQAVLGPLVAENSRLIDQVRDLAREVGRLQERVDQLEASLDSRTAVTNEETQVHALRVLLDALRPGM